MLNGIRENIPMSTKCSQEPIFQNHDDRKLATVKHNLESPQNPALNGTTDITGIVCQLVAHKYHFTTYWMKKILLFLTWVPKHEKKPNRAQHPSSSKAPKPPGLPGMAVVCGAWPPVLEFWLHHLPAATLGKCLTFLFLCFLICKVERLPIPTWLGYMPGNLEQNYTQHLLSND